MPKHQYTLNASQTHISPETSYGYYDLEDGTEGGGLWFNGKELTDYDGGTGILPRKVIAEIRELGYIVGEDFE